MRAPLFLELDPQGHGCLVETVGRWRFGIAFPGGSGGEAGWLKKPTTFGAPNGPFHSIMGHWCNNIRVAVGTQLWLEKRTKNGIPQAINIKVPEYLPYGMSAVHVGLPTLKGGSPAVGWGKRCWLDLSTRREKKERSLPNW